MFYQYIARQCDEWFRSPACTVADVIGYIEQRGMMRDAQVSAIKVFLYLKLACGNQPLLSMFRSGWFKTVDLSLFLPKATYDTVAANPAAAALYWYAHFADEQGNPHLPQLAAAIEHSPAAIDYDRISSELFGGVDYTDYLFSLPMGAGKTFLMAAFIYLDLYFAMQEPDNPVFAHNFIILAPSGLKSSILPSLKNILRFDPTWVLPENAARQVRSFIRFEVLDEGSSQKGSNIVKNPNAQKINNHQPLDDCFGLVALTNAEKVILDRMGRVADDDLFVSDRDEYNMVQQANELRTIIGRLPRLGVYVDEVHHVADDNIRLRQVVGEWSRGGSFAYMLGFSGTPYLEKAEKISILPALSIRNQDLTNVVSHYSLADGIGNFLKQPTIRYENAAPDHVLANGVSEFFNRYMHTVYADGTCAKLAVFCSDIEQLETVVYPQVAAQVAALGLSADEAVLKNHQGNKDFKITAEAKARFAALDTPLSKVRVVLLVNIGKEGWDCRSLTGVVLPGRKSSQIKVLQTTCRCLRQVVRHEEETALIWLSENNAATLNQELKKYQHTNIDELNRRRRRQSVTVARHSRQHILDVPPMEYTQLHITYTTTEEDDAHTAERLADPLLLVKRSDLFIHSMNLEGARRAKEDDVRLNTEEADYYDWLYTIQKESFLTLTVGDMRPYDEQLRRIFDVITVSEGSRRLFNEDYAQQTIRSNIRKAFCRRLRTVSHEEEIHVRASLISVPVADLERPREYAPHAIFYPDTRQVNEILQADDNDAKVLQVIKQQPELRDALMPTIGKTCAERMRSYHYLPYHFDSQLEKRYFAEKLLDLAKEHQLEAYFNGDDTLTGFRLECFKQLDSGNWTRINSYVPDFLLMRRDAQGQAERVLIIETKGAIYADSFRDRRHFMENKFLSMNRDHFDFLYLEDVDDKLDVEAFELQTLKRIKEFFKPIKTNMSCQ